MKRHCLSVLALLVMIVLAFGSVDTSNIDTGGSPTGGGTSGSSPAAPAAKRVVVTKSDYDRIADGMSYRQVAAIIGSQGEEMSRNKIEGVPGVMESVETVMYVWQNEDGTNMNAMFQNDRLMQKSQFGLK